MRQMIILMIVCALMAPAVLSLDMESLLQEVETRAGSIDIERVESIDKNIKEQALDVEYEAEEISPEDALMRMKIHSAKKQGDMVAAQAIIEKLAESRGQPIEYISDAHLEVEAGLVELLEGEDGQRWVEDDVPLAITNYSEINPSMASTVNGDMYTAVEYSDSGNYGMRIYKSTDGGQTWYAWYWMSGGLDVVEPSIAVGEGAENWLFVTIEYGNNYIGMFRVNLDNTLDWNFQALGYNSLGVSNPRMVTDGVRYYGWYPYLIWNSKGVDNWVIQFSRSFDYGDNWTVPVYIGGYCGYPDQYYNAINAYPDIDWGGRLWVAYDNYESACTNTNRNIHVMNSENFGSTWSSPATVSYNNEDDFAPRIGAVKNYAGNDTAVVGHTRYDGVDNDVRYARTPNGAVSWFTGCILCTTGDEMYPDLETSYTRGTIHAAMWHDYNIDYMSANYLSPWSWSGRSVSDLTTAFPKATVHVDPTAPLSSEAGIAWTDARNYGTSGFDVYYDTPRSTDVCYDATDDQHFTPNLVGDWNITHVIVCNDTTITMNGDLNIFGSLTLNNVDLRMNVNEMGEYGITVQNGGAFYINERNSQPSRLMNGDNASAYGFFRALAGSTFEMRDSEMHDFGWAWNLPNYNEAGMWIEADNVVLENNWIDDNHFVGVFIYNADNAVITGNTFTGNDWDSVLVWGSDNTQIRGNTISGGSDSGIEVQDSSNIAIILNQVSSVGDVGIEISNTPAVTVDENTVQSAGDDGITLSSSPNSWVTDNTVTSSGDDGIVLSSSGSTFVDNNVASFNGDTGIVVSSSDEVTVSNSNANNNWRGIYVSSSDDVLIDTNEVQFNTWYGVHFYYTTAGFVRNNDIYSTSGEWDSTGLYLSNSPGAEISQNDVQTNKNGMVLWYSGNAGIHDNTISNNNDNGVSLQFSGSSDVYTNTVFNNGGGISLSSSDSCQVNDNTATYNDAAITLYSSDYCEIYDNFANHNSAGISLTGSSYNQMYVNDVNDNAYGISLTSSSMLNRIYVNDVLRNNFGIRLMWSSNYNNASNNIVTDSIDYGGYLFRVSNNEISSNNFDNSQSTGIYLERADDNRMYSNTIQNAVNYGINLFESYSNELVSNDVRYSGDIGIELSSSLENIVAYNRGTNSGVGISLRWSDTNQINNNIMDGNDYNMKLLQSDNNYLHNNQLSSGTNLGMELSDSNLNSIIGNFMNDNGEYGMNLYSSDSNYLYHNEAGNNGIGIYLDWSPWNNVTDNLASNNGIIGIAAVHDSNDNRITGNTVNDNGNISIKVSHSHRNYIFDNEASGSVIGMFMDWSEYNTVEQNTANNNDAHGITLEWYSNHNTLVDNTMDGNVVGMSLMWSSDNEISSNDAAGNNVGLNMEWSSNNNLVQDNYYTDCNSHGILLSWDANDNQILQNTITNSVPGTGAGVYMHESEQNQVDGNTIEGNRYGIYLSFSENQDINTNRVCDADDFDFYVHNSMSNIGDDNTCFAADGWDDTGDTGCTNPCYAAQQTNDLEITGFTVMYPEEPSTGEPTVFRFYMTNHADEPIDNVFWKIESGQNSYLDIFNTVPISLGPGQMIVVTGQVEYTASGTYTAVAKVDPENRIFETDYLNNDATAEVIVGGAALADDSIEHVEEVVVDEPADTGRKSVTFDMGGA